MKSAKNRRTGYETGRRIKKVEKVANQEEAKKVIEEAGIELTDEEMDQVAGGSLIPPEFKVNKFV